MRDPGLLEREDELAIIDERAGRAARGQGSLLLVEGVAGIGKTRLLEAARDRVEARGLAALCARASELEREYAFGVARQCLQPALSRLDADRRAAVLDGAAAPAAAVLDVDAVDDRPAGQSLDATLRGLHWLCANLAGEGGLAIAVDDAQLADEPSLRWLSFICRRLADLPALVLVAIHTGESAPERAPLTELRDAPAAERIAPRALSAGAVARLMHAKGLAGPGGPAVAAAHAATGGNPVRVRELLAAMRTAGVAEAGAAGRIRELGSQTVSDSVQARVRQLPPAAADLARALAVLEHADVRTAARVAELDPQQAQEMAGVLVRASILRPGSPLRFAHPLIRASFSGALPRATRSRMHARAARALADARAGVDAVTPHLLATDPADDPWVVAWLRHAARRAAAGGAFGAAAAYLRRALAEPPRTDDRAGVLLELGRAEAASSRPEAEGRLRAALEGADSPQQRARIALELGRALMVREHTTAAIEAFDEGIAALGGDAPELALRLDAEAIMAAATGGALGPDALDRARRVMDRADGSSRGGRLALASAAWTHGLGASMPAARVVGLAERALAGGALLADEGPEAPAVYGAANALAISDRLARAGAAMTDALAAARRLQSCVGFATASTWRAWARYRQGVLDEAEADARQAIPIAAEHADGLATGVALAVLLECLLERGRGEEAAAELEATWDEDRLGSPARYAPLLAARGRLHAVLGRPAAAVEDLRACASRCEASGIANPGAGTWRPGLARLMAAMGARDEAQRLVADELEVTRAYGAPRQLGVALRTAGLLASGNEAIRRFREAVETLERSEAQLELARARTSLGAALLGAGRTGQARDLLRDAFDAADRCGAVVLAGSAHRSLVAAGGRPRRPVGSGAQTLTPGELRIARLAAAGATDREIAEQQFLTIRMVEMHLARAYRKLGIASRSGLADALGSRLSQVGASGA